MIRFVNLTQTYWTDPECGHPICAFLSTVSDRFYTDDCGHMTFGGIEDIEFMDADKETISRCRGLVPEGFFNQPEQEQPK